MIELKSNQLVFSFPEVHERANCEIDFQRTLRIPDDNRSYPLPPGLGRFPVSHVDDYGSKVPSAWITHGGVFLPMYQAEALWINFQGNYPCAIKIATGKINAVTGDAWTNDLQRVPQDYVVVPKQPWLDGFHVSEDMIRQFVAMPLGEGYTAEEQLTGKAEHGGLQIIVYPMKADAYERMRRFEADRHLACASWSSTSPRSMGLAPGGLMRQHIYSDPHAFSVWDTERNSRCFVHLLNSQQYQAITGEKPPHEPPTAKQYTDAGLPWFDYYSDAEALGGSSILGKLKGLAAKFTENTGEVLPDNGLVAPKNVNKLSSKNEIREGDF